MEQSSLRHAFSVVESMKRNLEAQKAAREQAKRNGNYKRSSKNIRFDNKTGNNYDYNVWIAEENLKRAKENLKRGKENLKKAQ